MYLLAKVSREREDAPRRRASDLGVHFVRRVFLQAIPPGLDGKEVAAFPQRATGAWLFLSCF